MTMRPTDSFVLDTSTLRRLLVKIEIGPEHWLWTGATTRRQTPQIHAHRTGGKMETINARRLLWLYYTSEQLAPNEAIVRTCEEPLCINPRHLVATTDRRAKKDGRRWRRSAPPRPPGKPRTLKRRRHVNSPKRTPPVKELEAINRIYAQVVKLPSGHWLHSRGKRGAQIGYRGSKYGLGRLLYALHTGQTLLAEELLVNRCGRTGCLNPAHFVVGDLADVMRARSYKPRPWTHCSKGHPLDEANTHLYRSKRNKDGSYRRECRTCKQARRTHSRELALSSNKR